MSNLKPQGKSTGANILLVDDDPVILDSLSNYLRVDDWKVKCAGSGEKALKLLETEHFEFIITDIDLPGITGLELLRRIKMERSEVEIIIMTGKSTEEFVIQALKAGASDYFQKPIRGPEVEASLLRCGRLKELSSSNTRLKALVSRMSQQAGESVKISDSKSSRTILDQLKKISLNPEASVLLLGESGVGKEVAARMIHKFSCNEGDPFVALNCGGIAETLLERELFGHERGAFTGAEKRTPGIFEMALGGTVLLDEISELNYSGQSRLNRVLEERSFRRVGGVTDVHLDKTRIIAATNKNLEKMVAEKQFREDLYFRLRVVPVTLPPLRERWEDIIPLAIFFLEKTITGKDKTLAPDAIHALENYSFPGNIRELKNIIENAAIFSVGANIKASDLSFSQLANNPDIFLSTNSPQENIERGLNLQENEIALIQSALEKNNKNHSRAAKELGITPQTLYRRMEKYRIN